MKQLQERLAKIEAQLASVSRLAAANTPMNLDDTIDARTTIGIPNGSSLLDNDLFAFFTERVDSNASFSWTDQPLAALELLDNLLLNQPQPALQSGSEDDLSPTDLSLLHGYYFDFVYSSFPFVNKDRFTAESTGGGSPALCAL